MVLRGETDTWSSQQHAPPTLPPSAPRAVEGGDDEDAQWTGDIGIGGDGYGHGKSHAARECWKPGAVQGEETHTYAARSRAHPLPNPPSDTLVHCVYIRTIPPGVFKPQAAPTLAAMVLWT